ncbi:hypothetical protein [Nonomuraea sp. NPDC049725]|uniref:hypothetical protein n=1 Tax=Nonomuraea sp. NPDC049725 TaxID=3154508 RepID=UPI003428A9FA
MTDTFAAVFIAIAWVVLAALIQNSGKKPRASKPGSALGSMAYAGLIVGAVLLAYLALTDGFR